MDVRIDRGAKTVAATIRVKLDDNGANGVGEMAPKAAQQTHLYRSLPAGHDATKPHQRLRSYAALKGLVHAGLKKYWSRKLNALGYSLTVTSVEAQEKHMDDIGVEYNTNAGWMRSSNPGKVRGFYSFFGNLVPERAVYNVGWIEYEDNNGRKVWSYDSDVSADRDFSHTAAHELGHEILSAYGGDEYSYGHRGSSTFITQTTKDLSSGSVSYPISGEIDLMKYYNNDQPPDFYLRSVVSEVDAQSLIWLARVKFND